MSELLQLASALRKADDKVVSLALFNRRTASITPLDYFDLADALLHTRSISAALATLPRSLAQATKKLAAGEPVSDVEIKALEDLFLVYRVGDQPHLFEAVANSLANLPVLKEVNIQATDTRADTVPDTQLDTTVFAGLQAVTELLFELEVRQVRQVRKGSVGLADVKRLATHLRSDSDYAREVFELAQLGDLMEIRNGLWQLTALADAWVSQTQAERWGSLANKLLAKLTEPAAAEFRQLRKLGVDDLSQLFEYTFPFADSAVSGQLGQLRSAAKLLGLSVNGSVNAWFDSLLAGKLDVVIAEVGDRLPKIEERLICQADLTLIAPGPLATKTEMTLRRFVDTEQIGLASSYRITALSLSHGLETGLTEAEIRELLTRLSGRDLPQPLDYLLREVSQKFGRLRVSFNPHEHRSQIWSDDAILLKQIENDTRIRHLSIRPNVAGDFESRMDSEVVYHALRSVGYTAVRYDAGGQVISPRLVLKSDFVSDDTDPIAAMLQTLKKRDSRIEAEPESDDRLRQIQLALKNKSQLEVTVKTNSGDEVVFVLEPIGLANNRLRARDRKADIERTLPLDKILRVKLTTERN